MEKAESAESMARVVARILGHNYDRLPEHKIWFLFWLPSKNEIRAKAVALLREIANRKAE